MNVPDAVRWGPGHVQDHHRCCWQNLRSGEHVCSLPQQTDWVPVATCNHGAPPMLLQATGCPPQPGWPTPTRFTPAPVVAAPVLSTPPVSVPALSTPPATSAPVLSAPPALPVEAVGDAKVKSVWKEHAIEGSGKTFWHDSVRNVSVWSKPAELEKATESKLELSTPLLTPSPQTWPSMWSPVLPTKRETRGEVAKCSHVKVLPKSNRNMITCKCGVKGPERERRVKYTTRRRGAFGLNPGV